MRFDGFGCGRNDPTPAVEAKRTAVERATRIPDAQVGSQAGALNSEA